MAPENFHPNPVTSANTTQNPKLKSLTLTPRSPAISRISGFEVPKP